VVLAREEAFERLVQVLQQVPPVRDLYGCGRALARPFGVGAPAVAADDSDAGVSAQPRGERRGFTVWQQLDGAARAARVRCDDPRQPLGEDTAGAVEAGAEELTRVEFEPD
jgi:hypothetical protein